MSTAAVEVDPVFTIHTPQLGDPTQATGWHGAWGNPFPLNDDENDEQLLQRCELLLDDGAKVWAYRSPTHPRSICVQPQSQTDRDYYGSFWHIAEDRFVIEDVDPFLTIEALGEASTRQVQHSSWSGYRGHERMVDDSYSLGDVNGPGRTHYHHRGYSSNWPREPYLFLECRLTHPETGTTVNTTFRFMRPTGGKFSIKAAYGPSGQVIKVHKHFYGQDLSWEYSVVSWTDLWHLLGGMYQTEDTREDLWTWGLNCLGISSAPGKTDLAGVKSLWNRKAIKPNLLKLVYDEPLLYHYFLFLHSSKNQDKVSNNNLIKAFLTAHGADYDAIVKALRESMANAHTVAPYKAENKSYGTEDIETRSLCLRLPGGAEANAEKRAKKEWQYQQGNRNKALAIGVDETKHKRLLAAIEKGDIPIGIFHEPSGKNHMVNTEFDLWERALAEKGWAEVIYEIAATATRRSTYTKRLTSFLMFLFTLPAYLDRHAPRRTPAGKKSKKGWRAMPVYVDSSDKLELEEPNEEGTVKTRSALTPVADNEAGVVTIPYAALQIQGYGTTYMYSDRYYVAEAGMNDPQGPGMFVTDLAEKLNGRDDYGLMWYTLTGTERNTGYPTFLIIYERLTGSGGSAHDPREGDDNERCYTQMAGNRTRVHFHRVRPCRSKGGAPTPSNRLILACYKYMAGNVAADEIYRQQGDILLIKAPNGLGNKVDEGKVVAGFEDHRFEPLEVDGKVEPVTLYRSTAKTRGNRLGWVDAPTGFRMPHPEHEDIEDIPPGIYEVKRCKSWESNPMAVWSFSMD